MAKAVVFYRELNEAKVFRRKKWQMQKKKYTTHASYKSYTCLGAWVSCDETIRGGEAVNILWINMTFPSSASAEKNTLRWWRRWLFHEPENNPFQCW